MLAQKIGELDLLYIKIDRFKKFMDPKDPSMFDHEVTGKTPLAHLYHFAHEVYADVSLSIGEIVELANEHGWDYPVEATIKVYRRPEPEVVEQNVVEIPISSDDQQPETV